ncbi:MULTISPECIES: hypothetical protein [Pseudomonas]|uniref:hypothetical protein n=1 Tax=Pseudomonas TaxID=286 RepID=UPI001EE22F92|nr:MULTISPECIES: hypothetical protein [Pseudomonas]MDQ0651378.1 hypothetical protein [Pseudomonas cedrina]
MSPLNAGCRVLQWLCLLGMFVSASAFMLSCVYLERSSSVLGVAAGGFVWGGVGLLFAFVFGQSRTARATLRFMASRLASVLLFAAVAAFLVGLLWVEPEREFMDAQLKGASAVIQ